MRTKFCPHCGSDNIHREEDNSEAGHHHECNVCYETWTHCSTIKVGLPSWHWNTEEVDIDSDEFDNTIARRGIN